MSDNEMKVDKKIDIRGEVCPYTFIKSKLAIEGLESGGVLQVLVNYAPSAENVPRSMEMEGHEVISVEPSGEKEWVITVKKK